MPMLLILVATVASVQAANLVVNGDLETAEPFYWSEGQDGGTLSWADDQFHVGLRSLKIVKTGTADAASWMCGNQAQRKWNHMEARLYNFSCFVMTDAATFSATDGERIGLLWTFQDASGNDIVAPVFVPATAASDGAWEEVTGSVLLTAIPQTAYCEAVMESGATGTAWFDHFGISSEDDWTVGFNGGDCSTPKGWGHWSAGGDAGYSEWEDVGDEAHSGSHVAVMIENDDGDDEMNFDGEPVALEPSTNYVVGVWVKTVSAAPIGDDKFATNIIGDRIGDRAALCFYFLSDWEFGWSPTGGDQFLHIDQRSATSDGWVRYWGVVKSPEDAIGGKLLGRIHPDFQGEIWYDDFFIFPAWSGPNLVENGDLETYEPFYWYEGETGGTLTWDDEEADVGIRSLKIDKTGTTDAASWISGNQAQRKWNHMEARLYNFGSCVMTDGATFSATAGERIGMLWSFLDASGAEIVAPVFVPATAASDGDWEELTGSVLLTAVPMTTTCEAIMESGATGTSWFDDFFIGSEDDWTVGFNGGDCSTPTGWGHWSAGGDAGYSQMEEVANAHSGSYVAKMMETDDGDDEMNFDGEPIALEANEWYEFSVWVNITDAAPIADNKFSTTVIGDRIADRASLCFYFLSDWEFGWSPTGGDQFIHFDQRSATSDGWVNYRGLAQAPADAIGGKLLGRIHPDFQGTVLYDDFVIRKVITQSVDVPEFGSGNTVSVVPTEVVLDQNYPNPFNGSTLINFTLPSSGKVSLQVFDILGRSVATLIDDNMVAGNHTAYFSISSGEFSSGIYFYRLATSEGVAVRRMVYVK
jgi:Secretion system C-terminal sorting domain